MLANIQARGYTTTLTDTRTVYTVQPRTGEEAVQTVINWAVPQFNGRRLVTEGVHYGWLDDNTVKLLADHLKTQHTNSNPAVDAEPRRGYEIKLENGLYRKLYNVQRQIEPVSHRLN